MKLFWDRTNLQSLCKTCHSRKTLLQDGAFGSSEALPRGLVKREGVALHVVCGPSVEHCYTYALVEAARYVDSVVIETRTFEPNTLCIELDHLIAAIDKRPLYEADSDRRRKCMVERNRLLRDSLTRGAWEAVWLVVPGSSMHERRFWRSLADSLTLLLPPIDACLAMLEEDEHGGKERREYDIHHWWSAYVIDPNDTVIQSSVCAS